MSFHGMGSTATDIAAITQALTQSASSLITATQQPQPIPMTPYVPMTTGIDPATGLPYGTPAATDYTVPLVVGGLAVAGLAGFMMMRKKSVSANRRRRSRRNRRRSRR